jgi:RNA 3'-phosphate cyclase
LKPQHLATLKALAVLSCADISGLFIGSRAIEFKPNDVRGGTYDFDIGTAGSISLLLQCLAPVASYANDTITIRIRGGTAVKWSPPIPIVDNVVWRALRMMGFKGSLRILKEGFYPKGGGLVEAEIHPIKKFNPITGTRCKVESVLGVSTCGRLPKNVAERQASAAREILRASGFRSEVSINAPPIGGESLSPGSHICLWAKGDALIGTDCLGERGKRAELVGKEAAQRFLSQVNTGAYVDLHTADNLILPMSLAEGTSLFTTANITNHTLTVVDLARIMTGAKIIVEGVEGNVGRITTQGVGVNNPRFKDD